MDTTIHPLASPSWRNRVLELRHCRPSDLADHPMQHKVHPDQQRSVMRGVLEEIGIADVLLAYHSPRTGELTAIDGHLRKSLGDTLWPTVILDVDDDEAAYILAVGDEIATLALKDTEALDTLLATVQSQDGAVQALLQGLRTGMPPFTGSPPGSEPDEGEQGEEEDTNYSRVIASPVYTPTGPCPPVASLTDTTQTEALLVAIDQAEISEDEKAFLRLAARRHTVFSYKDIAEYYAHATAEMQRLMEQSALVIIDFNQAIALGYVHLSEAIAAQYATDYPAAC